MAKSQSVTINILANGSKAQQQFRDVGAAAKTMGKQVESASAGIAAHMTKASEKLRDVGSSMMDIGTKMTARVTLPIVAGFAASIKAASDFNESLSKTQVIFGSAEMKGITKWADGAATSMGLSKRAAMDSASTFGIMAKNAGIAGRDVTTFSEKMTGLSSDLASFFNTKPEEAVTAMGAAFRGESEPIRRFGVSLSVATIQARALSEGIVKAEVDTLKLSTAQEASEKAARKVAEATKKYGADSVQAKDAVRDHEQAQARLATVLEGKVPILTAEQKLLATQAEILAQTSAAQGDFARTADGVANSQRTAAAEAENAAASFGQVVLPAYKAIMDVVRDAMRWFDQLTESQKRWIAIGAAVLAVIGPLVTAFGAIVTIVGALLSPVGLVVVALAALAAGAVYAYRHFEGFRNVVDGVMSWLRTNVPAALDHVKAYIADALGEIRRFWDRWGDDIKGVVSSAFNAIKPIISAVMNGIKATIQTVLAALKGDWGAAWDGLKGVVKAALDAVVAGIRATASLMWDAAQQIMRAFFNGIKALWGEVMSWFSGIGGKIVAAIGNAKTLLLQVGKDVVQGFVDGIKSMGGAVTSAIGTVISGPVGLIGWAKKKLDSHSPSKVFHAIGEGVSQGMADGIKAKKQAAIDETKRLAEEAARVAQDAVSGIMSAFGAGRSLEGAQRDQANAEEDLAIVRARQSTLGSRIAAAEAKLAKARENATKITAEEQLAIEQAADALKDAQKDYAEGKISAAALAVAQERLRKAQEAATDSTSEVSEAERELAQLRDEESSITKDLTEAERRLRDAKDRLTDAMLRAAEAAGKVNDGGSTMLRLFERLAEQAGLSRDQIGTLIQAINSIPQTKTINIETIYTTTGTPPGGKPVDGGQDDSEDLPGHKTPVTGKNVQMNYFTIAPGAGAADANAIVDALRAKGLVRPDGQVVVTR